MANGDGKKKRVSALDLLGDDKEKKEKKVSALDLLSVSEEGESAEPGKPQPAEEQASVSSTEPSPSSEKSEASDSVGEDSVPEGTIQTPNAAYSTEAIYLDKFSTPIYARSASDPRFTASNINVYYDPSEDTDIARARQELADQREPLNRRLFEAQQDENVGRGLAEAQDVSVELSRIDQAQRELERRESEMEDARTDAVFGGMFRYEQNGRPIKRSSMLNAIMDKEFLRDNRNSLKVIALTEKQPEDKEVKALLEHNLKHLDDSMFIDAGEGMVAQSMDIVRALIRSPFFIGEAVSREIGAEGAADTFKALQEVEHPMTYGWKKTAEELREKKFKQEDGIVEMLAKGDFAGAGREAFVSGMSSAPYLAMAAAGGNIGLGLIGLTTATQKREELGGLGVTDDKAATRGAIRVGVGEVVTERITLGILKGYFKGASGTLKNTIPKAIAAGAKRDVIKGYLSAFAKQAPKTLVDLPLKEMPSEIFASLNESAVANATGAENISPEEALKRAFDEGFAAVGLLGTAATINVVRSAATMARDLKAADSQMKQRFKDLSVAAEEIGGDIGEGMQKEADQILNDHVERLKELTPEELKEVTKLEKDISELKATEVDSPEAKRVVANKIKEKQARIDEVYELKEKEGPVEIEEYNALSPDEKLELQLRAIEQMENEMAEQGIKEYEADIEVILTNSIFSSSFTMVDERASQILQQDIDNLEGNLEGETRFSVAEEGESADAKSKIKFDAAKESQGMMPRFSLGDDVAAFIKDSRGQGISEAAIRIVLNRRGVAQEDIVVAFEKAGPKANQKSKVAEVDIPQAPELTPQKEVIEQKKEEEPTQKPKEGAKETDELREQGEAEQTQEPSVGDMREVDGAETTQTQEAQVDIPQAQIESASKERVFKEIDGIVEKTKARKSKKSDPKVLDKLAYDNALQYLQESKWYEEANDIERESAVRELRKMVNQKEKSAPFPKRIFQEKREEKTVTMTDKQALKKQIKDFAKGVREGRKAQKEVAKEVNKMISDNLQLFGDATPAQVKALTRRAAKIDFGNEKSVDAFVDYAAKVEQSTEDKMYKSALNQIKEATKPGKLKARTASGTVKGKVDNFVRKVAETVNVGVRSGDVTGIRNRIGEIEQSSHDITEDMVAEMEGLLIAQRALEGDLAAADAALGEIKGLVKTGRSKLRETLQEKSKRYNELKSDGYDAVTGGKGIATGFAKQKVRYERKTAKHKIINATQGFLDRGEGFRTLLDKLSRDKGRDESGYGSTLDKIAYEPIAKARDEKTVLNERAVGELSTKLEDLYGSKNKYKKALNENNKPELVGKGEFTNTEGETVRMVLSQNQAYPLYQYMKDPRNVKTFREMGWTDEMMQAVEDHVKPKVKQWADWQMEEFYPKYYDKVNKVYKEQNYIDLPRQEFYVPLVRDASEFSRREQEVNDQTLTTPTVTYGSLKSRQNSKIPFSLNNNGDLTLMSYMEGMNQYISFAKPIKDLNVIFKDPKVREGIKQFNNSSALKIVDQFISDLSQDSIDSQKVIKSLDQLRGNTVTASLALAPSILIKQLSSFPAYAVDIPTSAFLKGLGKFATNPIRANRQLMESPYMRERYNKGFDRDMAVAMAKDYKEVLTGSSTLRDKLMFMVKWGDKGAILLGGYSVYDYHKNKALKAGKTPAQAKQIAIEKFEEATKLSQQSTNVEDLSDFQRLGSIGKLFTMYMTSPMAYFRQERKAVRDFMRGNGRKRAVKRFMVYHFVLPMLFQYVASGLPGLMTDWDEEDGEDLARAATLGSLNGIFVVGGLLEYIADSFQEKPWTRKGFNASPAFDAMAELGVAFKEVVSEWTENEGEFNDDVLEAVIDFSVKLDVVFGIPANRVKKMIENWQLVMDDANDFTFGEKAALIAGYPPYVVTDKSTKKRKDKKPVYTGSK